MKICVDENIPLVSVAWLKESGHDVLDIRGTTEQGLTDEVLWEKVQRENRLLITTDKGFAAHRAESHYGILISFLFLQFLRQAVQTACRKVPDKPSPKI